MVILSHPRSRHFSLTSSAAFQIWSCPFTSPIRAFSLTDFAKCAHHNMHRWEASLRSLAPTLSSTRFAPSSTTSSPPRATARDLTKPYTRKKCWPSSWPPSRRSTRPSRRTPSTTRSSPYPSRTGRPPGSASSPASRSSRYAAARPSRDRAAQGSPESRLLLSRGPRVPGRPSKRLLVGGAHSVLGLPAVPNHCRVRVPACRAYESTSASDRRARTAVRSEATSRICDGPNRRQRSCPVGPDCRPAGWALVGLHLQATRTCSRLPKARPAVVVI